MDTSDLISIIIPVFNPGKYFIRCIESCINQTYTNLEIILVDDCSTDPYTVQLLNEYAAKDSRIRLMKSPQNSGQAYCRNMGIEACKGKYFAMIDNDDSFAVRFIERTHEAIVKYDTDLVLTDICVYTDEDQDGNAGKSDRDRFDLPFKINSVIDFDFINENKMHFAFPLTVYAKLFNTERYLKSGLFFDPDPELRSVEDEMWASRLEFALKNFYFMPFVGVFRCMRSSSDGAASSSLVYCRRSLKSLEKRYLYLREKGIEHLYGANYIVYVLSRIAAITSAWEDFEARRTQLIDCLNLIQRLTNQNLKRYPIKYDGTASHNWTGFYNALYNNFRRTNVWWFALPCINDVSDIKMITARRFLEALVDNGMIVSSISTSIRQSDEGLSMLQDMFLQMHENNRAQGKGRAEQSLLLNFADNAVNSMFINLVARSSQEVTEFDNRLLEQTLMKVLATRNKQPDVVLVSGTDPCSLKIYALMKQIGYKLIYVAMGGEFEDGFVEGAALPSKVYSERSELGGQYTAPSSTQEVITMFDRFVTFSPKIAQEWQQRFTMPIECLGYLARSTFESKLNEHAKYVTITSSAPERGIAIFLKVAILMNKSDPDVKFLALYDCQTPFNETCERLHYADGSTLSKEISELKNLSLAKYPTNLDVFYDISLLMFLPDLEPNHMAEPVINALVNGVPVLTTNNGDEQSISKAVTYLDVPASTLKDHYLLPSDEEVAPYIEAIRKVLAQDHEQNRQDALQAYDLAKAKKAWNDVLLPYGKSPK